MTTHDHDDTSTDAHRTATMVDGNALAGMLSAVFADDATVLTLECGHCADARPLAQARVERDAQVAIVRCRGCTHTLMSVSTAGGTVEIRIAALAAIRTAPSA